MRRLTLIVLLLFSGCVANPNIAHKEQPRPYRRGELVCHRSNQKLSMCVTAVTSIFREEKCEVQTSLLKDGPIGVRYGWFPIKELTKK